MIVDVLGKAGFPRSRRALKPGGRSIRSSALLVDSGGLRASPAQPIRSRPISSSFRS